MDATNPAASAPMMDERRFSNHLCALDSLRLSSLDLLSWCTPFARIQPSIRTFAAAMAVVCCHFSHRTFFSCFGLAIFVTVAIMIVFIALLLWIYNRLHRTTHTPPHQTTRTKKANSAGGSPPSKEEGSSGAPTLVLTLPSPCRYYY